MAKDNERSESRDPKTGEVAWIINPTEEELDSLYPPDPFDDGVWPGSEPLEDIGMALFDKDGNISTLAAPISTWNNMPELLRLILDSTKAAAMKRARDIVGNRANFASGEVERRRDEYADAHWAGMFVMYAESIYTSAKQSGSASPDDLARAMYLAFKIGTCYQRFLLRPGEQFARRGAKDKKQKSVGGNKRNAKYQDERKRYQQVVDRYMWEEGHSHRRACQLAAEHEFEKSSARTIQDNTISRKQQEARGIAPKRRTRK